MQPMLPLIPEGASPVNEKVSVIREKKLVVYYVGMYPVYSHPENDHACFRLTIAQLITSGICKNSEIISVFGVTKNCVCRTVKQLRKRGVKSFFQKRNTRKGGTKEMLNNNIYIFNFLCYIVCDFNNNREIAAYGQRN